MTSVMLYQTFIMQKLLHNVNKKGKYTKIINVTNKENIL